MRRSTRFFLPAALIFGAVFGVKSAATRLPGLGLNEIRVREVTPAVVKPGAIVCALGDNVGASRVLEMYLSDGRMDHKVEILEQTGRLVRFRVPQWLPPGQMKIVVLNEARVLLEQPAYLTVLPLWAPTPNEWTWTG